jgi:hypothetical protein
VNGYFAAVEFGGLSQGGFRVVAELRIGFIRPRAVEQHGRDGCGRKKGAADGG